MEARSREAAAFCMYTLFFIPSMHKMVLQAEKIVEEGVNKRD
jgi:hypothetical protein